MNINANFEKMNKAHHETTSEQRARLGKRNKPKRGGKRTVVDVNGYPTRQDINPLNW